MASDDLFAPSGRDDNGNPTWLGQSLPHILRAAHDAARARDLDEGTGARYVHALLLELAEFTARVVGDFPRPPRITGNIPRFGGPGAFTVSVNDHVPLGPLDRPAVPPHPTCVETTTVLDAAHGARTYMCGPECPPKREQ